METSIQTPVILTIQNKTEMGMTTPFIVKVQHPESWYSTFSQAQQGDLPRRGFSLGKVNLNDEVASELSCIAKITGGEKDSKVSYMLAGKLSYSDARLQKDQGFNTTGEVVKVARLLREKGIGVKFDTSSSGTQIMILEKDGLKYRIDLGWSSPKEKPEQKLDPSRSLYELDANKQWMVRKGEEDKMSSGEPKSENEPIYFESVDDKKLPTMEVSRPEDLAKRVTGFADVLGNFMSAYYQMRNGVSSTDTLVLQIPDWETYIGDDRNLATVGEWKPSDTFSGIFGRSKWKMDEDIGYLLTEAEKATMPSFADIGGQPRAVEEAKRLVMSIKHADVFAKRGVDRPKGILLKGPPGTGKTLLAKAIAREANTEFLSLSVTDVVSKWFGEAEQKVQGFFDRAKAIADQGKDVIAFIDEIDSVVPPREGAHEATQKMVAVFLQNMDGLRDNPRLTMIAATNQPDKIDPAFLRPGRLTKKIEVGYPNPSGVKQILDIHIKTHLEQAKDQNGLVAQDLNTEQIANKLGQVSGADIAAIVNLALEEKAAAEIRYLEGDTETGKPWSPLGEQDLLDARDKYIPSLPTRRQIGFSIPEKAEI